MGEKHLKAKQERKVVVLAVILLTALLLLPTGTVWAWNSNYGLCFPDVINTPDTYRLPPNIDDGIIAGDNGWTSAWRYSFNNGSLQHDAVVQGIKDSQYLYLSFEVNHDENLIDTDAIVIAFDPIDPTVDSAGSAAERRLLQIFPLGSGGVASPVVMNYWKGYPWSGSGTTPPADTKAVATASGSDPDNSWFVELKIPRAAFGIPSTGNFGMYFNIVATKGPQQGPSNGGIDFPWDIATEYPWPLPPDTALMTGDLLNTPMPTETYWGTATAAVAACNGVYITPSDITTNNTPPSLIDFVKKNVFFAKVHNNSIDGAGNFMPVSGIQATFKIANFGLSNMWKLVPPDAGSNNPTNPPTNIAAATTSGDATADLTTSWTLSSQDQTDYAANDHQCILVELDSLASSQPWATVFTNRSAWTNMDFGYNSVFKSTPEIDPRGWGVVGHGKKPQPVLFDLWITKKINQVSREDALRSLEPPAPGNSGQHGHGRGANGSQAGLAKLDYFPAKQDASWQEYKETLKNSSARVSQLTYVVHGCVHTGNKVKIKDKDFEICKSIGSYGYVLRHAGRGKAIWKLDLNGPGIKPVKGKEGLYRISLDKPVKLAHRFEATDGPRTSFERAIDWSDDHRAVSFGGAAIIIVAVYLLIRRRRSA